MGLSARRSTTVTASSPAPTRSGITVADLTGDGRPDLIIANKGSNDVSILINVTVGNSFTFVPGPRLQAGVGPVATVVADVLGNGVPDLVVANSGSNNVWLLPGHRQRLLQRPDPDDLSRGHRPERGSSSATSRAAPGQDLVTVNSGSNTLTLISGLGTGSPVDAVDLERRHRSHGGLRGRISRATVRTSLVVANNGDGNISLFQAGDNGLALSSVLSSSGLPNPSGLALASFSGGNLEFYATTEGEESAYPAGISARRERRHLRVFRRRYGSGARPSSSP